MPNFIALLDANVLYPAPLRDLLMHLTLTELFAAKWTNDIHDEWIRNLLKNRPDISKEQLARTRNNMNKAVEDCLVTGYEKLTSAMNLPDPKDKHVLAAAITARADVIVTYNLKDFPEPILEPYGVEAQHPDVFISHLLDLNLALCAEAIRELRLNLKRPPVTSDELLKTFEALGLSQTVLKLNSVKDYL